jgi:hypothetical protein
MVPMVQLRDQRIAGKDHESEAVHDSTRDLTGSHCLVYVYFRGRLGSPLRPLFANLRSAFAFVLSTGLTSAIFGSFIRNASESKTWQLLSIVCQKIGKNHGGWKEL